MALFWRIWIAVTLVVLSVLTIFVGLATLQFGNINADLVGERLAVLAERTAAPFEAAAKIGLPLSTVRNADALLEGARQTDDAIVAIHVFDTAGRIVHSTAVPAPAEIPTGAAAARAASRGTSWHRETSEGFVSSVEILPRDGTSAGGILIIYPGGGSLIRLRAMAAELALAAIGIMIACAAVGALLLRAGLRRQIRLFEEIDGAILEFERAAWRGAAGRSGAPTSGVGDELRELLAEVDTRYQTIRRGLEVSRDDAP